MKILFLFKKIHKKVIESCNYSEIILTKMICILFNIVNQYRNADDQSILFLKKKCNHDLKAVDIIIDISKSYDLVI